MLPVRKAWVNWCLFTTENPLSGKIANFMIVSLLLSAGVQVYFLFDGTQYQNIGGVNVTVPCSGYCPDKQ